MTDRMACALLRIATPQLTAGLSHCITTACVSSTTASPLLRVTWEAPLMQRSGEGGELH